MQYQAINPYSCVLLFCLSFFTVEVSQAQEVGYIFCPECTSLANNKRQNVDINSLNKSFRSEERNLINAIIDFENGLIPDQPDESIIKPLIVGQGATSIGFVIKGWEHMHFRRFSGFYTYDDAKKHIVLINRYRTKLHQLMIQTTKTQLIALEGAGGYGVVYVVQPFLSDTQLSKKVIQEYGTPFKKRLLQKQAEIAKKIISYNQSHPDSAITIDIVNNNWEISDFNPDTMEFNVRLNDLAQPLFKENHIMTYDFYDQGASVVFPLNWIAQRQMKREFSELFHPRNLMMQALWGYDEPAGYFYSAYLWLTGGTIFRGYPLWAMNIVNEVLRSYDISPISSYEALAAYQQDKSSLACLRIYRQSTISFRSMFQLSSNVYMNPGETSVEMYDNGKTPGYISCLLGTNK